MVKLNIEWFEWSVETRNHLIYEAQDEIKEIKDYKNSDELRARVNGVIDRIIQKYVALALQQDRFHSLPKHEENIIYGRLRLESAAIHELLRPLPPRKTHLVVKTRPREPRLYEQKKQIIKP